MQEQGTFLPTAGQDATTERERVDLTRFVSELIAADGQPAILQRVFEQFAPTAQSVAEWARPRKGKYTRALVYRDEFLEVLVLTWATGSQAPIHDHARQLCWMTVVHGELEVGGYLRTDGGTGPGPARVEPDGPLQRLAAGDVDVRDTRADLHGVRLASDCDLAISVHAYSRPLDRCLVFDPRRGTCFEKRLRYDFIGPRTRQEGAPLPLAREAPEADGWKGRLRRMLRRTRETGEALLVPADVREGQAQVRMERVGHQYGGVTALRDVNLNVRSGELICLLGPSGCGKSTLLHALAGHVRPTSGTVSLDGIPVRGPGPDRLLMFQDAALFPWMTVEQNLTFVLGAQGLSRAERSRRARRILAEVELGGFEKALPHQLSGGMKMRAALARALVVDPPVLLMDEPFGSLDAQTRLRMQNLLRGIWQRTGKTVVFVTHDVHEALLLATRVVLLAPRPGRVVADLEVRLPHPRDPDDPALARLSGVVREALKAAEQGAEVEDALAQLGGWLGRDAGSLRPLGGHRGGGPLAGPPSSPRH